MREPHYGHAGTVYDGKMYISGGITHDSFQKELLCYDPALDTWEQRSPMTGMNIRFENYEQLEVFCKLTELFSRPGTPLHDNVSRQAFRYWRKPLPRLD